MVKTRYLVQCKFCGTLLFKTKDLFFKLLTAEIKCPNKNCKRICKLPDDAVITVITLDKKVMHT